MIAAVILGWNLADETIACGKSLLAQGRSDLHLIFVDNGSTDGSGERLRERFPGADVLELGTNRGIAAGDTAGLERAIDLQADFAFVLNNDTLFAPGCLDALVAAAERHSEAGVFVPKIPYESERGRIWSAGARRRLFPPGVVFMGLNKPDGPPYATEREIDYAPSCALLIRREVLAAVGLFDPGYFFYFDDWDYCERVRQAGYAIRYVPDAVVWHKVSLSTARSARPARWWYVMGRSAVLYYQRYHGALALLLYAAWFGMRETVQGNGKLVPLFLRGLLDALLGRPMVAREWER
jgi:GT2 family glycosyltransferase